MGQKKKVVVLDSGLDPNSNLAKKINFKGGLGIYVDSDNKTQIEYKAIDDIGHGTAVSSLIYKLCSDIEIIPIKIIYEGMISSTETMIEALEYIYQNIECDVINISAGIVSCDNIKKLYDVCKRLAEKGVIIVSAYDNGGAVSYPAAFDCVIGITGERKKKKAFDFKRILNDNADYLGVDKERNLSWINNGYKLISGNSFITPEFIYRVLEIKKRKIENFSEVVCELNNMASDTIYYNKHKVSNIEFKIKKAIVFPYNKEMHSLARYEDLLDFKIVDFYDTKYSYNVGKVISESIDNKIIKNILSLDWNSDFDTFILGHNSIISESIGIDIESYIVKKCIENNKNLFSCKDIRNKKEIRESNINLYCPHVDSIKKSEALQMHVMGCPVLGVVGTGPSQGKFTIQLGIRRELIKRGFNVGQLGTEPTAPLFGMDAVFPMGHESAVYVKGFDAIVAINQILGHIEEKEPDIIIFGSQSNTVPLHVGGSQDYPIVQHELLLGGQAEAYILCVSNDASLEYISRTISYLKGIYTSDVIAIAISPLSMVTRWSSINVKKELIDKSEVDKLANDLKERFPIPVLEMNHTNFYGEICDIIENYFS